MSAYDIRYVVGILLAISAGVLSVAVSAFVAVGASRVLRRAEPRGCSAVRVLGMVDKLNGLVSEGYGVEEAARLAGDMHNFDVVETYVLP